MGRKKEKVITITLKRILAFFLIFSFLYALNDTLYFREDLSYFFQTYVIYLFTPFSTLGKIVLLVKNLDVKGIVTYVALFSFSFSLAFSNFGYVLKYLKGGKAR